MDCIPSESKAITVPMIEHDIKPTIQPEVCNVPDLHFPVTDSKDFNQLTTDTKKPNQLAQFQYTCNQDNLPAIFVCRLCKKTFYNATALQNHKNTQHDDAEMVFSEGEDQTPSFYDKGSQWAKSAWKVQDDMESRTRHLPDTTESDRKAAANREKWKAGKEALAQQWDPAISGVKFIASEAVIEPGTAVYKDGLTTRTFTEDTSYLIVKIEGDLDPAKSGHNIQMKPKSLVDLRGPFICTFMRPDRRQCRQIFFNCCAYSLHYHEEHTKRRKAALRCQVCEKRLDKDQIMFSCRLCGLSFRESRDFDDHNRVAHAKMKPHKCPLCPKRFTQQGGMQQHMRMHTGTRPFTCTFCPKAFTQKAGLDQHLRTHTKVKPFRCVICSKTFSQSVHLRQHMRTHTNIQPFECTVCGRRFKQRSHLNFHVRSHVTVVGTLPMESYAQVMQEDHLKFLNLANVQPVRDGDTLYYAAEIALPPNQSNANF